MHTILNYNLIWIKVQKAKRLFHHEQIGAILEIIRNYLSIKLLRTNSYGEISAKSYGFATHEWYSYNLSLFQLPIGWIYVFATAVCRSKKVGIKVMQKVLQI
jgi:hypothetical protein